MTLIPVVSTPAATTNFEVTPFNIGEQAILSAPDNGNANLLLAQSATLTDAAVIRGLSFYVATAGGQLRLGIYDATGPSGGPGVLKAQTNVFTPVVGWNSELVTVPVMLPAGTYWLAYHPSSDTLAFRKGNGSPSRYYIRAFAALPAVFSTVTSSTPSHWSLYATFEGSAAMSQRFMLINLIQQPPQGTENETGWTEFVATEPSGEGSGFSGAGTRKIYVAAAGSGGSDANTGTQASPKLTISGGKALLRNGKPDWLLFKRGDTWTNQLFGDFSSLSGEGWSGSPGGTVTGAMLLSAYGTGARPLFKTTASNNAFDATPPPSHIAFVSLEVRAYTRDPDDPGFIGAGAANQYGFRFIGSASDNILLEDMKMAYYTQNAIYSDVTGGGTPLTNVWIRRSVFTDNYEAAEADHSEGWFLDGTDNLQLIETLVDRTSWNHDTIFDHGVYIQTSNGPNIPATIQGNIFSRNSFAGAQCRSGGLITDNLVLNNSYGLVINGSDFGAADLGATVTNNVVLDGKNNTDTDATDGIGFNENALPCLCDNNIVANSLFTRGNAAGIRNGEIGGEVPVNNTISNNIIFNWCAVTDCVRDGGTGTTLTNNDKDANGTNNNTGGFAPNEPFSNPTRSVGSYYTSIGNPGGFPSTNAGFLSACRLQAKGNWNVLLTAPYVNDYIRAGFGR